MCAPPRAARGSLPRLRGHEPVELGVPREPVHERHEGAAVAQEAAACLGVRDVVHLLAADAEQLGELLAVRRRLVEHDDELGVREHRRGQHGVEQVLDVLRDGRREGVALAEAPPRAVEERAGVLVLEHDVELVDEDVGAPARAPVLGHAVEHRVGDDEQPHRLELSPQVHDVVDDHAVLRVHVRRVGERVERAGGEELEREGQPARLGLRLREQLVAERDERGGLGAGAVVLVHERRAPVHDRLLLRPQPAAVELLEERHDELALVDDGVLALAVALHHVERVDVVRAPRRDADDLAAERRDEGGVLPLGVADHDVVLGGEGDERDQLLGGEALAGPRDARHKGVRVQEPGLVAEDEVARQGVLAEVYATRVHDLLGAERHEDGQALHREGAQC